MTLKKVVVTGNEAEFGGGIRAFADTQLVIKQSTIAGNNAGEGGGIDLRPGLEPDTRYRSLITGSTISGNLANKGGGVLADGLPGGFDDPLLKIVNSTVARNEAANEAGGIMADNLASVDVENSSIGYNTANADNVGTAVAGGVLQHSNASFSIDDSVIAHNQVGQGGSSPDCFATEVFSGLGNVLSEQDGCDVSFTTPFNRYSSDPIAKPLAKNGGPTRTLALTSGSKAIKFASACPARDQRGEKRPKNCDSGAYERDPK